MNYPLWVYSGLGQGPKPAKSGHLICDDEWNNVKAVKKCNCSIHGEQGIGLVCTHVAHAVDANQRVGFFWGSEDDLARPDAWCKACQDSDSDEWFKEADFKIFCCLCWDEAKQVCGGFSE